MKKKVLKGKKILLTRASEPASGITAKLERLGAEVVKLPTIRIVPPKSFRDLDRAIGEIENYRWIVFTSQNGVDFFFRRYLKKGKSLEKLKKIKIAAIGPATAKKIEEYRLKVIFAPEKYTSEVFVKNFKARNFQIRGAKILLPRADIAPDWLPRELVKIGARVTQVVAYRTVKEKKISPRIKKMLKTGGIDLAVFTSSSTVRNFLSLVGKNNLNRKIEFASIGPVTTKTARELGLKIKIQAKEYTLDGLVKAIIKDTKKVDG